MEAYAKVSVSELSQNLVPTSDTSENKRARTSTDCPPVHFYLSRTVGNDEFKSQIQTIWLQGHVISTSADKTVLEIAEEPRKIDHKIFKEYSRFPFKIVLY
jgi:hypothetical protein